MSEVKVNKISPRIDCGTVTVGDAGDSVTVTAGVPVTVNGDLKSNALKAVDGGSIISQCGTTITLGASGDTINLAAGATQTGFGRTGTVDWDTTAKTASFTAVSGNGYFVNTTSGGITVTLPAGSAGDIVAVSDYASTAQTNNIVVAPNGTDKINGVNQSYYIQTQGLAVTLVYVDATKGWKSVTGSDADATGVVPTFITATGGTVTCCGDYKIHTFTGPGTFTVCSVGNPAGSSTVDYLVVAGGGAGGSSAVSEGGGGGGAGGYRESSGVASGSYTVSPLGSCVSALPVTAQGYPITIGGGGSSPIAAGGPGCNGSNSVFSSITSAGGGGAGGQTLSPVARPGSSGGSGGGAGGEGGSGGTGNTPPVSPPQGNPGGTQNNPLRYMGGGGGGATTAGVSPGPPTTVANGGSGATSSINGTPTGRAGGGGGGADVPTDFPLTGTATDGGGNGGSGADGSSATANTGGGGGGGGGPSSQAGGSGGSGIVIIRYKYQ